LGYVKDTTLGVDEISSFGSRLRGILEVTVGPVPLASLKIDEVSNIELTSMTGKLKQSAPLGIELTAASGSIKQTALSSIEHTAIAGNFMADGTQIKLGGMAAAEQVIKGTSYTTAENLFLVKLNVFIGILSGFFTALVSTPSIDPAALAASPAVVAACTQLLADIATFQASVGTSVSTKTFTV